MPDTCGHGARHIGSRCQIHGVTVPDTWGHGAGHTGSRCRAHGVTVPDTRGHGARLMGSQCRTCADSASCVKDCVGVVQGWGHGCDVIECNSMHWKCPGML